VAATLPPLVDVHHDGGHRAAVGTLTGMPRSAGLAG
jgi:hypothetical protein